MHRRTKRRRFWRSAGRGHLGREFGFSLDFFEGTASLGTCSENEDSQDMSLGSVFGLKVGTWTPETRTDDGQRFDFGLRRRDLSLWKDTRARVNGNCHRK